MRVRARTAYALACAAAVAGCTGTGVARGDGALPTAATVAAALPQPARVRIAFMPDVHFHDVYAAFQDGSGPGVPNPRNGRTATIRTMQAQLTSTRLFNENYFALLAALDDAAARGVKLVALPGDYSDDGQPVHVRGLARILDDYAARHGMRFFAVPGNHDPVRPLDQPGGKPDYLGRDPATGRVGVPQPIYSRGGNADCSASFAGDWARIGDSLCTEEVRHMGYAGLTRTMAAHGFLPRPGDLYYETPYSDYAYGAYAHRTALAQADWSRRGYRVCREGAEGTGTSATRTLCRAVTDASYLVEPVKGLWLVGLDANVYVPTGPGANDFTGSGNQGYNAMRTHKPHVLAWLRDVVARGEAQGKQVVAFSHFPMAEFYDGASDDIEALLGAGAMQLQRRPTDETTRALADTGLQVHVGGHMHFNDTSVHRSDGGRVLFNIQAPSLAAYVPAYKLMTLDGSGQVEVETVRLSTVPRFDEFFDLYRAEHAHATHAHWDASILEAADYGDFTRRYLGELVRLRLLDDDWHCDMRELVKSPLSGADLLVLSQLRTEVTLGALSRTADRGRLSPAFFDCLAPPRGGVADAGAWRADLAAATVRASALARSHGMRLQDFGAWQALDLATDFVRLANAGDLAFADIPSHRGRQYRVLAEAMRRSAAPLHTEDGRIAADTTLGALFQARFGPLMAIMHRLAAGTPSDHVRLDLESGTVADLSGRREPF